MPGDACLKAPGLIADVRITWSPHTIGDDQPRPGTSAFHDTLIVADHFVGSVSIAETPRPECPRNCGHVVSTGAGASGTSLVTNSRARMRACTPQSITGRACARSAAQQRVARDPGLRRGAAEVVGRRGGRRTIA